MCIKRDKITAKGSTWLSLHQAFNSLTPGWCVRNFNTLRPRQNGCHFPDDTFKGIFLNENVLVSIKNSLKFVPKGPINNIPALVQIMAWHRPGDKSLSEPMMVSLPTHICVTRPQWVNATLKLVIQNSSSTLAAKLLLCVTGHIWQVSQQSIIHLFPVDFTHKGSIMWSFGVFFIASLTKLLNKQSNHRWFDTPDVTLKCW